MKRKIYIYCIHSLSSTNLYVVLLCSDQDKAPVPQERSKRRDLQWSSGLHQVIHRYIYSSENTDEKQQDAQFHTTFLLSVAEAIWTLLSWQKNHEEGGSRGLPEGGQLPGASHCPSLRHSPGGLLCRGGRVPAGVHTSEHLLFVSTPLSSLPPRQVGRQLCNGTSCGPSSWLYGLVYYLLLYEAISAEGVSVVDISGKNGFKPVLLLQDMACLALSFAGTCLCKFHLFGELIVTNESLLIVNHCCFPSMRDWIVQLFPNVPCCEGELTGLRCSV